MADYHTVEQGEYLALIAKKHGFYDWRTIYNHPENAKFRQKRPNPNVIYPGDQIFIPDKGQKALPRPTGSTHVFRVPARPMAIKVILKDHQERKPLANLDCLLKIGDTVYKCKTDNTGLLVREVPIGTETAELSVPKTGLHWTLQIGHLDPTHQITEDENVLTGIQARLNNLGYYCGEVDGILGPHTKRALRDFQRHVMDRENADGELDGDTRAALDQEHAS